MLHFARPPPVPCGRAPPTSFYLRATEFEGVPIETDEATPFWCPIDAVPYVEMWPDDAHWLPPMLAEDRRFRGYFTFDGDRMLSHEIHPA